jgi:nucleoid-associated protein YgaU
MNPRPRHSRLVGVAACLALLVLLLGLPAVLLALGWRSAPSSLTGWWTALTNPDDGHLTVLVLEVVAWIVWGLLAATIITEGIAAVRGREAPRLPGLRWSQIPARRLVAAALLLFIAVPTLVVESAPAAPAAPSPPPTATVATQPSTTVQTTPLTAAARATAAPAKVTHTVRRGETLWSIAEHYLGSGRRYPEIVTLNHKLLHGKPGFLRPGWVLTLPAGSETLANQTDAATNDTAISRYTVLRGDTLSEIAARRLGDARVWPRIFEASRDLTQPDGRRLTDPNLIIPGWTLLIPITAESTSELATTTDPGQVTATTKTGLPAPSASNTAATPDPTPANETAPTTEGAVPPVAATPNAPATSVAKDDPTADSGRTGGKVSEVVSDQETTTPAPWLLVGLSGAGALLAAGLLAGLRKRRRAQFRARRPGRTIPVPPTELIPVEKTLVTEGAPATPTSTAIDQALRLLAASGTDHSTVPQLQAIQLLPGEIAVQLAEPGPLADPWREDGPEGRRWLLAADAQHEAPEGRAPYPQLVTVGQGDDGTTWMLNLEQLGIVSLTGDPTYAADFARYVAAEIAVNPWSRQVQVDCVGIAPEAVSLDPTRIHHHPLEDPEALDAAITGAVATVDRCADHHVTAATGRGDDLGGDVWNSWLVLVKGSLSTSPLDHLLSFVNGHPARTGTAIILVADAEPARGILVRLTGHGRVQIPTLDLDLVAVGLTPDEAEGCAELLAQADQTNDVEMPADGEEGWREYVDAAGALRQELVLPRDTETIGESATSVISAPDDEVLEVAAATADDLHQLAPLVPEQVRTAVTDADPDLDSDLAAWASGTRPHLRLLGPIQARTGTTGNPTVVAKRKAFYAELLAFLALHPNGVSTDQLVDAFATDAVQMRVHLSRLRIWLGVDRATGENYLPEATKSPAAIARGMGVYQLVDVLTDIDLFRRLRARAQARGPEGIPDLQAALALVTGEPFTGQRSGGWAWLADSVRIDQHMVCAVVDVAHLVSIVALNAGDLQLARTATETALLAAPYEDTPRLDLAAVVAAEGDYQAADHILRDDLCNRSEDSEPPDDLTPRTADLVSNPPWLRKGRVA